jgi:hypothetical protein
VSRQQKPSRPVSVDEQIQVVLAVLKGELSPAGAARRHGVSSAAAGTGCATKYCPATVTPASRVQDAPSCLRRAVVEAERIPGLDDLRAGRGVMDVVDAGDCVIGEEPAPIAVVTDNGPCFRGATFADARRRSQPVPSHLQHSATHQALGRTHTTRGLPRRRTLRLACGRWRTRYVTGRS